MRTGQLHREVVVTMGRWVREQLVGSVRAARWVGVTRCVTQARGVRRSKGEPVPDDEWRAAHAKRVKRQCVTHAMRANDARWVEHGAAWARRWRAACKNE